MAFERLVPTYKCCLTQNMLYKLSKTYTEIQQHANKTHKNYFHYLRTKISIQMNQQGKHKMMKLLMQYHSRKNQWFKLPLLL